MLERIIIANNKFAARPDPKRHFWAMVEFYKYLRGDPRVFEFYKADKQQMLIFSCDWMYGSGIDFYKKFAVSFVGFMLRYFPQLEFVDFIGRDSVPDGFKLKFQIEENQYNLMSDKTQEAINGTNQIKAAIKNDFGLLRANAQSS